MLVFTFTFLSLLFLSMQADGPVPGPDSSTSSTVARTESAPPTNPMEEKKESVPFSGQFLGRGFWGNVVGTDREIPELISLLNPNVEQEETTVLRQERSLPTEVLAFTQWDQTLLAASEREITLWNVPNNKELRHFKRLRGNVSSLSVSQNGKLFLSGSSDRRVFLWSVDSDNPVREFPRLPFEPKAVAIGAGGNRFAFGMMDGKITIITDPGLPVDSAQTAATGSGPEPKVKEEGEPHPEKAKPIERTFQGHTLAVNCLEFSPDQRLLLSGENDRVASLWDVNTGNRLALLQGHQGAVLCAAFSPNGRWAATGGADNAVILWNVESMQESKRFSGHRGEIVSVAFSADGSRIMTAAKDRFVYLWNTETGEKIATLPRGNSPILAADWEKSSERIAVAYTNGLLKVYPKSALILEKPEESAEGEKTVAKIETKNNRSGNESLLEKSKGKWDSLPAAKRVFRFGRTSNFSDCGAIGPDGTRFVSLATAPGDGIVWNADTGRDLFLLTFPLRLYTLAFHPRNANFIATGSANGNVQFWDLENTKVVFNGKGHSGSSVRSVAFSRKGDLLLSGGEDGSLYLWDIAEREVRASYSEEKKQIISLAVHPDGRSAAVGSEDQAIGIWTFPNEYRKLQGHRSGNVFVAFTPDGTRLVSAASDGTAILWDWKTSRRIREFKQETPIGALAVSPDGRFLATGGKSDELSVLWEIESGQPKMLFPNQGGPVSGIMFHPKKLAVITVGGRSPILWDISAIFGTGKP